MIIKREKNRLRTKIKFEKKKEDKYKQKRSGRQNDKVKQWVMHTAVKNEVRG